MRIGIFTDNHESGLEHSIICSMRKENAEAIIGLGDFIERRGSLLNVLRPFCESGLPFFAIPGNYESPDEWKEASDYLTHKFANFHDSHKNSIYKFNKFNFLFLCGAEHFNQGFNLTNEVLRVSRIHDFDPKRTILFSHEPSLQGSLYGTDCAVHGESRDGDVTFGRNTKEAVMSGRYQKRFSNRGSELLREFLEKSGIRFSFSGHIHEGLSGTTEDGIVVGENEISSSLYLNPGPAKNGIFATADLEINRGELRAKYRRHLLLGSTKYEGLKD